MKELYQININTILKLVDLLNKAKPMVIEFGSFAYHEFSDSEAQKDAENLALKIEEEVKAVLATLEE